MKQIRIAAGAGYGGDRIEPALDNIRRGNVDYIMFECLAERTIALAQKEKKEDPGKGYNPLMTYRMERVLPLLKEHPVKIITNMGAANPVGAAEKIRQMAEEAGLGHLKIAAVTGDDVVDVISKYYDNPIMETGEPLGTIKDKIISANAYIGARQITEALKQGADIVVTGRVADPALATGPLMYEFEKDYSDDAFLGKTIVAGHLLECAAQVTGGYFADPGLKDVPELWNVPFPILTFDETGNMWIEKLPDTGGLLSEDTVKEQLLYEIQDPSNYFTPDVIADFSHITAAMQTDGRVLVQNAGGRKKTGQLKVSVGYEDGYIGTGEISYGGAGCAARARLAEEIIRKRLEMLGIEYRELRTDFIGINSLYGKASLAVDETALGEVRLRVAARSDKEEDAAVISKEVEALYVNGPAGGGGARGTVEKIVSVASVLISESDIQPQITWKGGTCHEA